MERRIKENEIERMIIIYNAVKDGWIVKKIDDNKYEFKKKTVKEVKEFSENRTNGESECEGGDSEKPENHILLRMFIEKTLNIKNFF